MMWWKALGCSLITAYTILGAVRMLYKWRKVFEEVTM